MIDALVRVPPFTVRVRSPMAGLQLHLDTFYADGAASSDAPSFVDFDIRLLPGRGLRRWWRPQARFVLDGDEPFHALPAAQAGPLFEWGLNWAVAQRPLGYLVMHAAVVARGDRALMMPGFPGAGKSTLCSALTHLASWRLLTDELALLDPADGRMVPHPRPISVKNRSIELVSGFPGSRVGPVARDTRKGDVAHLACPEASRLAAEQRAAVSWVLFPRFDADTAPQCEEIGRAEAFALIAEQSFNRERMGEAGFRALCDLLSGARCFEASYRSTEEALDHVRAITGE